jgi:uncharacterized protein
MSNERIVAALKTAFSGYSANDFEPLFGLLSDDFRFEMTDSLPQGGVYTGPAEFAAFWKKVHDTYEHFWYDTDEVIDAGDTLVVPVRTDVASRRGFTANTEHLFLFRVKDGEVVYARLYVDTAIGRDLQAGIEPRRFPRGAAA